jgi:hypothetical protein
MSVALRFRTSLVALACLSSLSLAAVATEAVPPARVMIVGTYHFDNPGLDLHNVEVDDVLKPKRQAELVALTKSLAAFDPNLVAVEWPAEVTDTKYAAFRDNKLEESRNEVVQLGFRLAAQQKLARVHGIDVDGDFPFEAVQAWAEANGKSEALGGMMQQAQAMVARMSEMQKTHTITEMLRHFNSVQEIELAQSFYLDLLKFGAGDQQPGAELNAAWAKRNFIICARLLQALKPGDRAVVFYGQGHAHALQRCAIEAPGVELVAAGDYLK